MDMRDLPRVNLQDLLDGGYEPVLAHQGDDAFIVMAPPGGAADQVLENEATPQAPRRHFANQGEVAEYQLVQRELAERTVRQRAGLATRGRPPASDQASPGNV